jgi:hypothetical protein
MLESLKLHMMLEPTNDGRSIASVLELPDYRVEGQTEAEAIDGLRILVTERLAQSHIVPLEVPLTCGRSENIGDGRSGIPDRVASASVTYSSAAMGPADENPWVKFAGVFKDDPYFADIAEELRRERRLGETLADDE